MRAIEAGDFHQIAKPAGEYAVIGRAQQSGAVFLDRAYAAITLPRAPRAVFPLFVPGNGFEHFFKRAAVSGAAQVEDGQSFHGRAGQQKRVLNMLAQRLNALLANAEVAQAF